MSPEIKKICDEYIERRFSDTVESYKNEWIKKFEGGNEWQLSDYTGREILREIAPNIYPKYITEFFIRVDNNKITIIIDVEGGLVQEIHNKPDNIEIIVRDYDVEGVEEDRIKTDEDKREYIEIGF